MNGRDGAGERNRREDASAKMRLFLTGFGHLVTRWNDPRAYHDPEYALLVRRIRDGLASPLPRAHLEDLYIFGLALGSEEHEGFRDGVRVFVQNLLAENDAEAVKKLQSLRNILHVLAHDRYVLEDILDFFSEHPQDQRDILRCARSTDFRAYIEGIPGVAGVVLGGLVDGPVLMILLGILGLASGTISSEILKQIDVLSRRVQAAETLLQLIPKPDSEVGGHS